MIEWMGLFVWAGQTVGPVDGWEEWTVFGTITELHDQQVSDEIGWKYFDRLVYEQNSAR